MKALKFKLLCLVRAIQLVKKGHKPYI